MVRASLICTLSALLLLQTVHSQTGATQTSISSPPGQATGQRIGNAISAAITTAFPAAQKIIDVIWPNNSQKATKPDQAKPNLTQAKTAADTKQQSNFSKINQIASELATMRTFLNYCVSADEYVITIQTLLTNKSTLSAKDVADISKAWGFAAPRIQKLGATDIQTQIENLKPSDPFVQQTLFNIADANLGLVQSIQKGVDGLNKPSPPIESLRADINQLRTYLTGVNSLAGIVIGDISIGLKSTEDLSRNAQGGQIDEETKNEYKEFNSRLQSLYPRKER